MDLGAAVFPYINCSALLAYVDIALLVQQAGTVPHWLVYFSNRGAQHTCLPI